VTALYCLLLCLTPPFCHPANNSDNSKGGTWSGTLPQKAVTACHRDRFILIIALFDPAVLPRLANLKHFQRRNLQWLSAAGGT